MYRLSAKEIRGNCCFWSYTKQSNFFNIVDGILKERYKPREESDSDALQRSKEKKEFSESINLESKVFEDWTKSIPQELVCK